MVTKEGLNYTKPKYKTSSFTFSVVNCVQSHPFDCAIATSGIDNTIKASMNEFGSNDHRSFFLSY